MKGQEHVYRLHRYDLDTNSSSDNDNSTEEESQSQQTVIVNQFPYKRTELLEMYNLPSDSVIKLSHEGKLIPWSLLSHFPSVDIGIFRPHQNIKPKVCEDVAIVDEKSAKSNLVREQAHRLASRITSLEQNLDETILQTKTERDLQLLTKQISFLEKRLDEAERSEWINRNPEVELPLSNAE